MRYSWKRWHRSWRSVPWSDRRRDERPRNRRRQRHREPSLTRTRVEQPVTPNAPAAPIQVAQAAISVPKRPTICDSPAFGGQNTCHRPHIHLDSPKNPAPTPPPGDISALLQPLPHPYHINQRQNPTCHPVPRQPFQCSRPNTKNLAPPSPPICPPIPLESPPKPCHRPPFSPTSRPMPYLNEWK